MTTFKRYLFYRIENSALRMLVFSILSIMLTQTVLIESIDNVDVQYCSSGLYIFAVILGIFASIIPILELSGFKNRRNLDTLYFFPINREKMAIAHYISGFFQVTVIYTATYVSGFVFLASQTDFFALGYMIPYYFLSLLLGLVIYSVFMFIFTQANSVADGVLFCLLWIFVISFVGHTLLDVIYPAIDGEDMIGIQGVWRSASRLADWGIVYKPINDLTILYQDAIEINNPAAWNSYIPRIRENSYMFFVWGVIGLAAAVGFIISFARKGAEKAGEISNSWFGYKLLIPVYGYCIMFQSISIFITIVMMIIGYIIYRRGFKFKKSDIILTAAGLAPVLINSIM